MTQMRTDCKAVTVYFDGACPLCRMEIEHYRGQTGAGSIAFVDASQPDAEVGQDLEPHKALTRFHVRDAEGRLFSGASAFVLLWHSLPEWQWVARLARRPVILPALEVGYRAFLVVRPVLAWALRKVRPDACRETLHRGARAAPFSADKT